MGSDKKTSHKAQKIVLKNGTTWLFRDAWYDLAMATQNKNVALLAHLKRRSGYGTDTRRNTLKFSKKVRNYFPLGEKKVLFQKYFF